jgi:hypothetical protein
MQPTSSKSKKKKGRRTVQLEDADEFVDFGDTHNGSFEPSATRIGRLRHEAAIKGRHFT